MPLGGQCTESCEESLYKLFSGLKKIFIYYGCTELYGISQSFEVSSGCLGSVVVGASVYIRDLDSGGKLAQDQTGEIMVQSLTAMKGYLNRDLANKEFFTEDGWAHTGDLGYYDTQGRLYFKDRVKEMIKVGADWVGPEEIESCIEQIAEVQESCVWSTYNRDQCDDTIHAAVVTSPGSKLWKDDLVSHLKNKLLTSRSRGTCSLWTRYLTTHRARNCGNF